MCRHYQTCCPMFGKISTIKNFIRHYKYIQRSTDGLNTVQMFQRLQIHFHCLTKAGVQPISPDTAAEDVYLPVPRKYLVARFCTAFIK